MTWGLCLEQPALIELTMNSSVFQSILELSVRPSVRCLAEIVSCNRTMLPSTAANVQDSG